MSTYPEECVLSIERRTLPGETAVTAMNEIEKACAAVRAHDSRLDARITPTTSQMPSDVSTDAPIVGLLRGAMETEGVAVSIEGMSAWTDAALLNAAGIPTICFGPGDIGLAHAAEEFVPISEIETATRVLARVVRDWCESLTSVE
jgi:acetylornithine deacetylase